MAYCTTCKRPGRIIVASRVFEEGRVLATCKECALKAKDHLSALVTQRIIEAINRLSDDDKEYEPQALFDNRERAAYEHGYIAAMQEIKAYARKPDDNGGGLPTPLN